MGGELEPNKKDKKGLDLDLGLGGAKADAGAGDGRTTLKKAASQAEGYDAQSDALKPERPKAPPAPTEEEQVLLGKLRGGVRLVHQWERAWEKVLDHMGNRRWTSVGPSLNAIKAEEKGLTAIGAEVSIALIGTPHKSVTKALSDLETRAQEAVAAMRARMGRIEGVWEFAEKAMFYLDSPEVGGVFTQSPSWVGTLLMASSNMRGIAKKISVEKMLAALNPVAG